jgi:pyridoxine kinase
MSYKRVLTIQDVSCVGQCSLTVALPIISACGVETAVLPSAVLSTHTGGFKGYTFRDLTEDMPKIREHWEKENIKFDAVYTGYLGSAKQIAYVKDIVKSTLVPGGALIVDPAMADNGALYPGFDQAFAHEMGTLCAGADIILPNITEACFLTGTEYREEYDEEYVSGLAGKLAGLGAKAVVLTGVGYRPGYTGVAVYENGRPSYYEHRRLPRGGHGTGDVYASAFVGALMNGRTIYQAAKIAADYTVECIEKTQDDENHWYGVKFETAIPDLIGMLKDAETGR